MLFNSLSFFIFLPIAVILYWKISSKYRNTVLLLLSCYFYAVFIPKYIFILFFIIILDYFLAIRIESGQGNKKLLLILSILANIGILFIFKYFNFFNENISTIANFLHWNYTPLLFSIILPLGLSFHVFQSLAYIIEVYNKKVLAERNIFNYATYVLFFPQLVAGPIERPGHLLPQIRQTHHFDRGMFIMGIERILFGFFKKIVIADQIAAIINPIFASPPKDALVLFIISVLFLYQLYCDFSGYTDIALGSAMLLGFSLRENFNRPLSASSFSEFWRRWHMSLSTWFRDYVFIPLGGRSNSFLKTYRNIMAVFILSGLWHGANWTFVIWGALNGFYLIAEDMFKRVFNNYFSFLNKFNYIKSILGTILTFVFITISFIFFRSETFNKANWIILNIFDISNFHLSTKETLGILTTHSGNVVFYYVILSIIVMEVIQYLQEKRNSFFVFSNNGKWVRYSWYYYLIMSLLFFGHFGSQTFIYFQF